MIKRFVLIVLALLLLAACGGEFDDEFYEDDYPEEGYEDDEFYEDDYPEDDYEDEDYEDDDYPEDDYEDEDYEDEEGEYEEDPDLEEEAPQEEVEDTEQQGQTAVARVTSDNFAPSDCPFEAPARFNISCGYLTVPENREAGGNATIELAIAILPAGQGNAAPDPVIYLDGGPGGSALSSLEAEPEAWADYGFAKTRDLIFIDQRGTGYSLPSLNCPEMDDDFEGLDNELDCLDRLLNAGIDVTAYNTAENAADVADLADALGLDSYNLVGISYGTRLGLAIMRDHPEKVRSVVLDSPFPPNSDPARDEASITYKRILAVINKCEQDAGCAEEFPNLEQVLIETVERMNTDPPSDEIDGDTFLQVLYQAMFAAEDYGSAIPLLIYLTYEEDYSFLEEASDELFGGYSRLYQSDNDGDSEGMYTSVMCRDEFSFSSPDAAEDRTADEVPEELASALLAASLEQFQLCDRWGAGSASDRENAAVVSDIPTLVVVGEFDPATPPEWGVLTAETLENGLLYIIPNGGHSLLSTNQCVPIMATDFIANPTAPLDDGCLDQLPDIEFEY